MPRSREKVPAGLDWHAIALPAEASDASRLILIVTLLRYIGPLNVLATAGLRLYERMTEVCVGSMRHNGARLMGA